jgi:DNA-binding winged helix-turn-helix (wHTH) protein
MKVSFDGFVFDTARRELSRGGVPVSLAPKAFRLLELLVTAAPSAVNRESLYRDLWGETIVEDVNLSNLVAETRAALGDRARQSRFIKTVHRFGYRFVAPLSAPEATASSPFYVEWQSEEHPLRTGDNTVGRDSAVDIHIGLAGVSRRHALISVDGTNVVIRDLHSKNGTFVGGRAINHATNVGPGDTIGLGSVAIVLRRRTEVDSTMTEALHLHLKDR